MIGNPEELISHSFTEGKKGILFLHVHGEGPPPGESFLYHMLAPLVRDGVRHIFLEELPKTIEMLIRASQNPMQRALLLQASDPRMLWRFKLFDAAAKLGISIAGIDRDPERKVEDVERGPARFRQFQDNISLRNRHMADRALRLSHGERFVILTGLGHAQMQSILKIPSCMIAHHPDTAVALPQLEGSGTAQKKCYDLLAKAFGAKFSSEYPMGPAYLREIAKSTEHSVLWPAAKMHHTESNFNACVLTLLGVAAVGAAYALSTAFASSPGPK